MWVDVREETSCDGEREVRGRRVELGVVTEEGAREAGTAWASRELVERDWARERMSCCVALCAGEEEGGGGGGGGGWVGGGLKRPWSGPLSSWRLSAAVWLEAVASIPSWMICARRKAFSFSSTAI